MEVVSKNVHWLLPEEPSPCDIFLYFRGQYASAIPAGQLVTFKLLEKLAKAYCTHVFIRQVDAASWDAWTTQRCPKPGSELKDARKDEETKSLYGNKRAELLSYVQKSLVKKTDGDATVDEAFKSAASVLKKVVNLPTLDWYFQQFHEPPTLFHHCGRVAFGVTIFLSLRKVAKPEEIEALAYSALIHELEGDLAENAKTVVSRRTLEILEANKHPVPREVLHYLELHDELCSGKGFPNNKKRSDIPVCVRVFTLFNQFDEYRSRLTGTRRSRFDRTKDSMAARAADYDSALWPLFWEFWERIAEAVT